VSQSALRLLGYALLGDHRTAREYLAKLETEVAKEEEVEGGAEGVVQSTSAIPSLLEKLSALKITGDPTSTPAITSTLEQHAGEPSAAHITSTSNTSVSSGGHEGGYFQWDQRVSGGGSLAEAAVWGAVVACSRSSLDCLEALNNNEILTDTTAAAAAAPATAATGAASDAAAATADATVAAAGGASIIEPVVSSVEAAIKQVQALGAVLLNSDGSGTVSTFSVFLPLYSLPSTDTSASNNVASNITATTTASTATATTAATTRTTASALATAAATEGATEPDIATASPPLPLSPKWIRAASLCVRTLASWHPLLAATVSTSIALSKNEAADKADKGAKSAGNTNNNSNTNSKKPAAAEDVRTPPLVARIEEEATRLNQAVTKLLGEWKEWRHPRLPS
jgi:hypothetical protein